MLEAFGDRMGAECELLEPGRSAPDRFPHAGRDGLRAALWSPHELRVESREAIPQLAAFARRAPMA